MVSTDMSEAIRELPDELVAYVIRFAGQRAEITAAIIERMGFLPTNPAPPHAFLIEVGAIATLFQWESQGFLLRLTDVVPSLDEVKGDFLARCKGGFAAFNDPLITPIHDVVFSAVIIRSAWEGWEILGADVLVETSDDDRLVDAVANFLLDNRYQLSQVLESRHDDQAE